ncbi:hypothetical protein FI667_g8059, partial [Globisporangium splendens]
MASQQQTPRFAACLPGGDWSVQYVQRKNAREGEVEWLRKRASPLLSQMAPSVTNPAKRLYHTRGDLAVTTPRREVQLGGRTTDGEPLGANQTDAVARHRRLCDTEEEPQASGRGPVEKLTLAASPAAPLHFPPFSFFFFSRLPPRRFKARRRKKLITV